VAAIKQDLAATRWPYSPFT